MMRFGLVLFHFELFFLFCVFSQVFLFYFFISFDVFFCFVCLNVGSQNVKAITFFG